MCLMAGNTGIKFDDIALKLHLKNDKFWLMTVHGNILDVGKTIKLN